MAKSFAVGDVFRLRIDAHRVGYGQIVAVYRRDAYYFAIYEDPHDASADADLADIVRGKIALLALSFDALLRRGDWEVVGNKPPPPIRWPIYTESTAPDSFVAVDHRGQVLRTVDAAEAAELPNRTIVAAIRVQKAFAALHGAEPWKTMYQELRY